MYVHTKIIKRQQMFIQQQKMATHVSLGLGKANVLMTVMTKELFDPVHNLI